MIAMKLLGVGLILIGIGLGVAKYAFGMDEIGYWTLAALVPGIVISWLTDRDKKVES